MSSLHVASSLHNYQYSLMSNTQSPTSSSASTPVLSSPSTSPVCSDSDEGSTSSTQDLDSRNGDGSQFQNRTSSPILTSSPALLSFLGFFPRPISPLNLYEEFGPSFASGLSIPSFSFQPCEKKEPPSNDTQLSCETRSPSTSDSQILSNLYTPLFIRVWQIIYGSRGIISQGGANSIDDMFSGIKLTGKKVLDVGCGLGGVNFYLAQKYNVDVVGVDKEKYMIDQANKLLAEVQSSLIGRVSFKTLTTPTSLKEFKDNSFDVLYCKEMLYHVPFRKKLPYLCEMFRVLSPGGILVVGDWYSKTDVPGNVLKNAVRRDGFCHFVTKTKFRAMVKTAHFTNITYRDTSAKHIEYSQQDINRLNNSVTQICEIGGNDTVTRVSTGWNSWLEALKSGQLKASILVATKPKAKATTSTLLR